ncbi:penicillin-binding protein 2 [endosymbiont of Riftia pachyptila (vent Ph05)]|uniref:Penicillin-binding protein 2 n=1 Tax=endosymbiont of Riftia pachyptila (vent Ph05) TaxID=1048808 RepID=G2DE42_9GAMM|nr:penicillin-binding protein 2 [endosymbiont of Riftia pachyptila (vent Ph05)]
MPQYSIKDHLYESQLFINRSIAAAIIVTLMLLLLGVRMVYLQVVSHEHYTTLSKDNRVKLQPLPPTRGLIYDRNGVILAQNLPAYSLEITPEKVESLEQTIEQLALILPISEEDRRRFKKLRRQRRPLRQYPDPSTPER